MCRLIQSQNCAIKGRFKVKKAFKAKLKELWNFAWFRRDKHYIACSIISMDIAQIYKFEGLSTKMGFLARSCRVRFFIVLFL